MMQANQQNIDQFFREGLNRSTPGTTQVDKFWHLMPAVIVPAAPVSTGSAITKAGIFKPGFLELVAVVFITVLTGIIIYTSLQKPRDNGAGTNYKTPKDTIPAVLKTNEPAVKDSVHVDSSVQSKKQIRKRSARITKSGKFQQTTLTTESENSTQPAVIVNVSPVVDTPDTSLKLLPIDTTKEQDVERTIKKEAPKRSGTFRRIFPARTDSGSRTRSATKDSLPPKK